MSYLFSQGPAAVGVSWSWWVGSCAFANVLPTFAKGIKVSPVDLGGIGRLCIKTL